MEKLNKDWITEKSIDFEYKKYLLLAYLQHVDECFRAVKLYPPLADLISHYRFAKTLKENKEQLASLFPQRLTGFDAEAFRLNYEKVVSDGKVMEEIESILDFSLPRFAGHVNEGMQLFDFIEDGIEMQPVGLLPLDVSCGYLFLRNAASKTNVYSWSVKLFEEPGSTWRALHTSFFGSYSYSITHTYEFIKTELVKAVPDIPNPAVYAAETRLEIPVEETFLPVARRLLMKELASSSKS
ncbi:MAG TPA: hypothetical protein VFU15_16400 [Bacteroidia bacterium]|nr:hypothetical protein [Bacteroidia bacterium]